jgi:Arc/MetJ-type ribon-helix-helix transcriptional regulator
MAPNTSLTQQAPAAPVLNAWPTLSRRTQRYDHGMTKVAKITISLPQEQATQAREAVARGEAASVSSYVSAALAAVAPPSPDDGDTLANLVADMIAEDGVPSPEAYAWADRVLGLVEEED